MKFLTVDSSVYLSAFLKQDPFHEKSEKFLNALKRKRQEVLLPAIVPLEVVNTLRRNGLASSRATEVFSAFYKTPKTRIIAIDRAFSAAILEQISKFNLKTADWIIASTCLHFKSRLISWDNKLLENTSALIPAQTPDNWLSASE